VDEKTDQNELIKALDQHISALNDDYYSARKYNLKDPKLTCIPKGTIYNYMKSLQKLGAQNKMPRVLNEEQASRWFDFLRKNGVI
jgi:pyruvate/oxaloacetate carboxyltransferase